MTQSFAECEFHVNVTQTIRTNDLSGLARNGLYHIIRPLALQAQAKAVPFKWRLGQTLKSSRTNEEVILLPNIIGPLAGPNYSGFDNCFGQQDDLRLGEFFFRSLKKAAA